MGRAFFGGGKVGMKMGGSRLPRGYTELAYIESSGTQYIDTGAIPASGCTAELGFTATYVPSDAESWVLGVFDTASGYPRMRCGIVSGAYYTDSSNGAAYSGTPGSYTTASVGVSKSGCTIPLYLFAQNEPSGPAHVANSKYKLYFCKIYNNGVLVRDFVPCLSDADGVGLYDFINNKFYGNAGTGSFVGSEVAA